MLSEILKYIRNIEVNKSFKIKTFVMFTIGVVSQTLALIYMGNLDHIEECILSWCTSSEAYNVSEELYKSVQAGAHSLLSAVYIVLNIAIAVLYIVCAIRLVHIIQARKGGELNK